MSTVSSTSSSAIVDQLMYLEAAPVRNNEAKIKELNSKKDLVKELNTKVADLQKASETLFKTLSEPTKTTKESKEGIASVTVTDSSYAGNLSINVKQLATSTVLGGDKYEGEIGITGSFKISIGDTEVSIDVNENDTLSSIRDKINKNKDFGATASLIDGRLILTSKDTGESTFSFEDTDGVLAKIGITDNSGNAKNILTQGQNSVVTVNGIEIENSSNTLKDVVEGVTIDLKDVGDVSIKIEEDVDKLVESIETFIKAFNTAYSAISDELKKDGGYFRGDSTLSRLKTDMRNAMTSKGNGVFKLLSDIGIEFSSTNFGKDAKLELKDKDKLKEALSENKDEVLNLFMQDDNNNGKIDSNEGGLLGVLNRYLDDATSTSATKKGLFKIKTESIESSIKLLESKNERLAITLEKRRVIYEKQFLQMDLLVEQMNSQLMGLSSMLSYMNT